MKYYIELTVRCEDHLTRHISEDFIDLSCPWVDIDPRTDVLRVGEIPPHQRVLGSF